MIDLDITHRRLFNQTIASARHATPNDLIQWLGAVQAQDYAAAKWALGLRIQGSTDDLIEQAFTAGTILRTHLMRPTWHFVAPTDIRWMLALTAPRVNAGNASWYRSLELDDATCMRSNVIIAKALQGGKQLTRLELKTELERAGLAMDDLQRLGSVMMRAELDGVICSGARRGKQFTYALLDERVPETRTRNHDEALATLVQRYFTSHGPATLKDFVWWSGLTATDAKIGLEMISTQLTHETVGSQTYWFANSTPSTHDPSPTAYLLPNFDEYTVGYTDRSAVIDATHLDKLDPRGGVLNSMLVLDGRVVGTWRRTLKKHTVTIILQSFAPLNEAEISAFTMAADRYGEFLNLSANIEFSYL